MVWYLIKYDIANYFNKENISNSLLYFIFVLIPCIYSAISLGIYLGESGSKIDLNANFFFIASVSSVLALLFSNRKSKYSVKKIMLFPISKNQVSIYLVSSVLINIINKILFIFFVVYGLFGNFVKLLFLACCLVVLNSCLITYFQVLLVKNKFIIFIIITLPIFSYYLVDIKFFVQNFYTNLSISTVVIYALFNRIKENIDINLM